MATASRRLPGIAVGVTPPPAVQALPRMDVAALVGFASTGPLHTPVAIESVAQFADVFGADAPLAWDETRGERVFAYLGPAVRAFFANGGRRCWVVRVARAPIANEFALPGLLSVRGDGTCAVATAIGRSEGSWSDGLRVVSALQRQSFAIDALTPAASPAASTLEFQTRFGLRPGDLIELQDGDGRSAFATIDTVRTASESGGPYVVQANVCAAFESLARPDSPGPVDRSGLADLHGFGTGIAATLSIPTESTPQLLRFDEPVSARLERGHWVRWSDGGSPVWLRIDEIDPAPAFAGSPPERQSALMTATVRGPAWRELPDVQAITLDVRQAHLVAVDLRVDAAGQLVTRLNGIGLTPAHPQAWWNHTTDADFHRQDDRNTPTLGPDIAATGREGPRFPLARAASPVPRAFVPLGVTTLFGPALAPLPHALTPLERDGLAEFDAGLFLDPELVGVPVHRVAELAEAIRFVRATTRPLRGLHAAWSIGAGGLFNEVSLLAIPDAIHLGWRKRPAEEIPKPDVAAPPAPPHWSTHRGACAKAGNLSVDKPDSGVFLDCSTRALNAPVLDGPATPVPPGVYRLSWTDSEPHGAYVLSEFAHSDLSDPREVYRGPDTEFLAATSREGVHYYQVVATAGDELSAPSNVVAVLVRRDDFVQNRLGADRDGAIEREWLAVHRAALRMAAAGGDLFVVLALPRHYRTEQAIRYTQRLRAVRQPPAIADVDAFEFTETRALSYGTIYFPWLQSDVRLAPGDREASDARLRVPAARVPPRIVPPDGVSLGVLAARATKRGAWVAPANEPLQDVVGVTPPIAGADWQSLMDAQINLIRSDPRGFLALSADTLAHEIELRPINVRRLLTLLRRLALRRGNSYVFEPNGPVLRRAVQRGFDVLLADMFRRGAFAGAVEEHSFRVVTNDTINTPRDAEAGRFLVELRVAPSVPMRFLAVQLEQTGARLTVSEEL